MGTSNIASTDINKVNVSNEFIGNANQFQLTPDQMQFTSSQNSIDQFLWSPSNVAASSSSSPVNQQNQMLMKFWNNPKQQAAGGSAKPTMPSIGRNAKLSGPSIVGYNQNNCDDVTNEPNELDTKIKDVHSPHRDYKQANSNKASVTIAHPSAPKDFGCDDTYEDGIDKDMRDLERRLESELEEHEKLWSPEEETPISQT